MKQVPPSMCCALMYSLSFDRHLAEQQTFTLRRGPRGRMGQLKAVQCRYRIWRSQQCRVAAAPRERAVDIS